MRLKLFEQNFVCISLRTEKITKQKFLLKENIEFHDFLNFKSVTYKKYDKNAVLNIKSIFIRGVYRILARLGGKVKRQKWLIKYVGFKKRQSF